MTVSVYVEVNDHWENLVTTGRGKQFADRCASERVEAILLQDGFDPCSHTSDEVVQIYSALG